MQHMEVVMKAAIVSRNARIPFVECQLLNEVKTPTGEKTVAAWSPRASDHYHQVTITMRRRGRRGGGVGCRCQKK